MSSIPPPPPDTVEPVEPAPRKRPRRPVPSWLLGLGLLVLGLGLALIQADERTADRSSTPSAVPTWRCFDSSATGLAATQETYLRTALELIEESDFQGAAFRLFFAADLYDSSAAAIYGEPAITAILRDGAEHLRSAANALGDGEFQSYARHIRTATRLLHKGTVMLDGLTPCREEGP